ncbi:MAG: hypothetical protein WAV25_02840 [Minisyncoccia bacterium]
MNKLVAVLLSLYIAAFLYTQVFFVKVLTLTKGNENLFWNHITILLIFGVFIFFVIQKHIEVDAGFGAMQFFRITLVTLSLIGLILSILYHIVPLEPIYNLPPIVDKIFATDLDYTLWLIAPLLVLFI